MVIPSYHRCIIFSRCSHIRIHYSVKSMACTLNITFKKKSAKCRRLNLLFQYHTHVIRCSKVWQQGTTHYIHVYFSKLSKKIEIKSTRVPVSATFTSITRMYIRNCIFNVERSWRYSLRIAIKTFLIILLVLSRNNMM